MLILQGGGTLKNKNMGLNIKSLLSGGISNVLDSAKGIIGQFVADPAEKAKALQDLTNESNRHEELLLTKANELEQAYLKDVDSARNRDIAIATSDKAPLLNKIIQPILALMILGSCFLFWYQMLYTDVSKEKEVMIAGITGSLTTLAMGVVGFYFGSSSSSAAKQKQLETMMNKDKE